ncbi:MAG: tetratricopeptide repeat protein [Lachnospiraceae bacterium]|nr:tetratricopeptide repeat protein [Lachnospiraceae bacterium]
MKLRGRILCAAMVTAMCCSGCGMSGKTENIDIGMEQVEALEYDSALESFQLAEAAGENQRLLYRGQGLAYLGKTMYAEAAEAFEKALACSDGRVVSMDYDINYYLATAYYKMGEKDKAIQVYDAIVALKEKEEDAYYLRGVVYIEKGDLERAQADFDRTMKLNPENYDRLIEIYCVLEANGYKEVGQQYLQAAMDAGTKNMTNYEKGRICYYLEDYDNARTYLEKARDDSGYEAVLFLGKTYETLGDNNYAISVYNTYLESGEQNSQVLNQLGLCRMKAEDYEGALMAFQAAMNIEDNGMMQTLKMNEIIAYERLGEYKQASVLLESYLKTYPDDEVAQREYTFLKTR